MIAAIVRSSVRFRLLVLAAAGILLIVGTVQVQKAPVDVLPEFTAPVVNIQVESLGLSADEVEQLITVPLEQDILNGVRGARTIRSDSVPGLSQVNLRFDHGENLLEARQLTQERLTQAGVGLPNVSRPAQMLDPISSTGHAMIVGLSTAKLTPIELSVLARWTIRPRLRGLEGVANVAIWGFRDRQLQVLVDPERLRQENLTVQQIMRTTGNSQLVSPLTFLEASTPGTGGFIDGPNQRLSVRHVLPFGTPKDLGNVPVEGAPGVRLGDVARVVEAHQQPLIGDAVVHGGPGLLLVVDKTPGANTLDVTRRVDDALGELQQGMPGVAVDRKVFRPASFIESAIDNLSLILAIAAALVLLALVALLRRWHAVLVSVVAIPVSLLAALLVLHATGGTINALAIAGLAMALGVVVDDAVVDSRNIARRLAERRAAGRGESTAGLVVEAARDMRSPLGFATLAVLLVAVPVLVARGLTASFVHPLALSFALAVLASMVVALTLTPALSVLLASRAQPARPSALGRRVAGVYSRALGVVVRAPAVALLVVCVVGLAGVAVAASVMHPDVPSFKERNLLVRLNATPGTSLGEMTRISRKTAVELRGIPGVRDVGGDIGRAITGDRPVGSSSAELWVAMEGSADYGKTRAAIRDAIGHTPGLSGSLTTYEADRTAGVLKSTKDTVNVRVFGADYSVLGVQARRLAQTLSGVDGVRNPAVERPVEQPSVQIKVKLADALRHGIKPGDVRRAAAALVSGITVGEFFEEQKVFEVVVRGEASARQSVNSVRNLIIDRPGGGHVRLRDVADVSITHSPVDIRHDAVSRYVDITLPVSGRGVGAVERDVRDRLRDVPMPLEYHAELAGTEVEPHTSPGAFATYVIAALLAVFLLLQAAFRSWTLAALFFLLLPFALLGGVIATIATGNQHSLGALAGLVAVFAIAVRQGVVVVRGLQRLDEHDRPVELADVLHGMRERVAPTAASTVAIAAAYIPFLVAGDVAGNEIANPMAVVVLCGLVTATLLNVFVLPATYLRFVSTDRTAPRRPWRPERLDPRQRLGTISRRGRHATE